MFKHFKGVNNMAKTRLPPNAKLLTNFKGAFKDFEIYGIHLPSKTGKGKDRIWFAIRQKEPKNWHQTEVLGYRRAVDIQFQK